MLYSVILCNNTYNRLLKTISNSQHMLYSVIFRKHIMAAYVTPTFKLEIHNLTKTIGNDYLKDSRKFIGIVRNIVHLVEEL